MALGDSEREAQPERRWKVIARVAVTLGILGYLAWVLDWDEFARRLRDTDPLWLGIAWGLMGLAYLLSGVRWWFLLRVQGIRLPMGRVVALVLVGQFFNAFLLGSTGGDLVKMFYILRDAPRHKVQAVTSIVIDRAMGLFVMVAFAVVALSWQLPRLSASTEVGPLILVLPGLFAAMIAGFAILAWLPFERLPRLLREGWRRMPYHELLERALDALRQHGRQRRLTLNALAVSALLDVVLFTAGYALARAIGLPLSYGEMLVILALVVCVISLPISVGGHGVRELAFVSLFAAFGVVDASSAGQGVAVLYSVLFFGLISTWSLVGGAVCLTARHAARRSVQRHSGERAAVVNQDNTANTE